jgi:hypothetical protein
MTERTSHSNPPSNKSHRGTESGRSTHDQAASPFLRGEIAFWLSYLGGSSLLNALLFVAVAIISAAAVTP